MQERGGAVLSDAPSHPRLALCWADQYSATGSSWTGDRGHAEDEVGRRRKVCLLVQLEWKIHLGAMVDMQL